MYLRKNNLSYKLCGIKNKKKYFSKICEKAIVLSKYHDINEFEQKNISLFMMFISKNKFKEIQPIFSVNCKIFCKITKFQFRRSIYKIQPTYATNMITNSSFFHRLINGIRFPIYFPIMDKDSRHIYVYIRIICAQLRKNYFVKYYQDHETLGEEIDYWSETFVEKIEINCSKSSLSIEDCEIKNVNKMAQKKMAYRINCSLKRRINKNRRLITRHCN